MKLRRLKAVGVQKFGRFLDSLDTEDPDGYSRAILTDPTYSDSVGSDSEVTETNFENKLSLAQYLHKLLKGSPVDDVRSDQGLWCWLSLFFFEQLCPKQRGGRYRPGARARWIPEVDNFQRYYRHLLAGPYMVFRAHADCPEQAMALLCGPVNQQGEIVEQIASRQEIVTNKSLVEVATRLYYDPVEHKPRRGSGGKGPGSPRRLALVMDQFSLTWDLYAMSQEDVLDLLPPEFGKFLKK